MHPAPSIILFTVLSGAGFGMLAFLGLDVPAPRGARAFWEFALAFALASGGLIASTFHLGHPERALKAFSQWRSSWLSREGVLAVATLALMGLYAIGLVFFDARWTLFGVTGGALALLTVFATSMIYMQMRTIPRWNHWSPPVIFLLYALAGGALLTGRITLSLWLLPLLAAVQIIAWLDQNRRQRVSDSTIGTATGLGSGGTVRQLMPPHSGDNYLTREMVFRVGRKRARPLRIVAVILAALVPFLAIAIAPILLPLAVLSHIAGALASRWLFFAEAKHVVGLYYGKS